MKIALIVVAVVILVIVAVVLIGYSLPVKHRAQADAQINAPPAQVFALITNIEESPSWRTGLKSVEILPSPDGRRRFREVSSNGTIPFVIEAAEPSRRLVSRIDDRSLPFGGTWTYELTPEDSTRTRLRITEDGEIYNPFFRFVSRFILGYDGGIKTYLADVERRYPKL